MQSGSQNFHEHLSGLVFLWNRKLWVIYQTAGVRQADVKEWQADLFNI